MLIRLGPDPTGRRSPSQALSWRAVTEPSVTTNAARCAAAGWSASRSTTNRLADTGVILGNGLDAGQFYPPATNLDLAVDPAQEVQAAVLAILCQVACAVAALLALGSPDGAKLLTGQFRPS